MDRKAHWERVYRGKAPEELTWFQEAPTVTLELLESTDVTPESSIIDVGGGTSLLVDCLLTNGYEDVTVLDVSSLALDQARERLGSLARRAQWIVADILETELPKAYDLWHDRAVFHFLTDPEDRQRYGAKLHDALAPRGYAIISTFAEDGPERCSGLPCVRYSPEALHAELGADDFTLIGSAYEAHPTPRGTEQRFQYTLLHKAA